MSIIHEYHIVSDFAIDNQQIIEAAKVIKQGGVVAFPTETVYGLGADATNYYACAKIFAIKGRPSFNPLIVHVRDLSQAQTIGKFNEDAFKLAHLWPGPLTMVLPLKKDAGIADNVTTGLSTVALRIPAHPTALALLEHSHCPIAAPSANPSGYISSTQPAHIEEHFASKQVFHLQSDQNCIYGLESTIVDLTSPQISILRYGFVTPETIEHILERKIVVNCSGTIKAPGMLDKHYSPNAKIRLYAETLRLDEVGLDFGTSLLHQNGYCLNLSLNGNLAEAAGNLYSMLRKLDQYIANHSNIKTIAVASMEDKGIGLAINDRLRRAAWV